MGNLIVKTSIIAVIAIIAVAFLFNASNTGLFVADFAGASAVAIVVLAMIALSIVMETLWNRI